MCFRCCAWSVGTCVPLFGHVYVCMSVYVRMFVCEFMNSVFITIYLLWVKDICMQTMVRHSGIPFCTFGARFWARDLRLFDVLAHSHPYTFAHTHTHRYKNWRTQICINIEPEGGGVLVTRISVWLGIIYKSGMNFTEAKHVVNHSTATLPHANRQYRLLYTLGLRAAQTEKGNSNVQRRLYER